MRRVRRAGRKYQRAKRARSLKILNAAAAEAAARYEAAELQRKAAEINSFPDKESDTPCGDATRPKIVSDLIFTSRTTHVLLDIHGRESVVRGTLRLKVLLPQLPALDDVCIEDPEYDRLFKLRKKLLRHFY